MKLVTLIAKDRSYHIGVLLPDTKQIIDLYEYEPCSLHQNMVELIRAQERALPEIEKVIKKAKSGDLPKNCFIEERDALLTSPIPEPISCRDGYAFRQHVESARRGRGLPHD